MHELFLVAYVLIAACAVAMWVRVIWLAIEGAGWPPFIMAGGLALVPTGIARFFYENAHEHFVASGTDLVMIGILMLAVVAFVATGTSFVIAMQNGKVITTRMGHILAAGPALLWSLLWFAVFHKTGPIFFEIFGTKKVVNTSFFVSLSVCAVLFAREYLANMRNVEAKMAEVVTFAGGKRTGQALTEGWNPLPGMLPLVVQVGIYALFRFSLFWGVVRRFMIPPITFSGTFLAYTMDHMAIILEVSGIYEVVGHHGLDDLKDDASATPWAKVEQLVASHTKESVNRFARSRSLWQLAEGDGQGRALAQTMRLQNENFPELKLKRLTSNPIFIGLRDEGLQRIFQEWAGQELRDMNQHMKLRELRRLFEALRRVDSGSTFDEAERIWESCHNGGRAAFRFTFG